MKKYIILPISLLITSITNAQTLSPDVVSSSGDYYTNSSNSLSWTIGEPVIETAQNSSNILTQGFQQSSYNVTAINEIVNENFFLSIYPNPTSDNINIVDNSKETNQLKMEMYDLNGKVVEEQVFQKQMNLNMTQYSTGLYFISIYNDKMELIQKYKIQKIK